MSDESHKPVIGFEGKLKRASASVEDFFKDPQGQPATAISIQKEAGDIVYTLGGRTVKKSRNIQLDAVVSESPDGLGLLVTFRHPDPSNGNLIVGVAIAPDDMDPEVDGVWVASEGSGGLGGGGTG